MTLDQLRIFVEVAERQHVTQAAAALNLTQSAVSGAIAALEQRYAVRLFDRVGRGIVLTAQGMALLPEARRVLDQAGAAEAVLRDLGGLSRGTLRLTASQTIAGYWLPALLRRFHERFPGIAIDVTIGNTEQAAQRVHDGTAELGFVEGAVEHPALAATPVGDDRLVLVQRQPGPAVVDADWIRRTPWVMREAGSGTRSTFEAALPRWGVAAAELRVALVLPSNEAVRTAAEAGTGAAVLSALVVAAALATGALCRLPLELPARRFVALHHRQRHRSRAVEALLAIIAEDADFRAAAA